MWLTGLPSLLSREGIIVKTYDGWERRARSANRLGYNYPPIAILCHHTASKASPLADVNYMMTASPIAPVGNMLLDREGVIHFIAAGPSNHGGKGGPWKSSPKSSLWIPQDQINSLSIGLEAANDGRGEPWPQVQQDIYIKVVTLMCDFYGISVFNVLAHHEWAPTRKIDPFGPSRFGNEKWDMNLFRREVLLNSYWKRGRATATLPGDDVYFIRPKDKPGPVFIYNGFNKREVKSDEDMNLLTFLFGAKNSSTGQPVELSQVLFDSIPLA